MEQDVSIVSNSTLTLGLLFYPTAAASEVMYLNELEVIRLSTASPEYQYHLKDHLGNVRTTFTTKTLTTTSYTTDLEAVSNTNFQNYTNTTFDLVDHTDAAGTTYQKVQLLNGGVNGRTGLAKSFAVMPGDEISVSAYCKYMNLTTTNNTNGFITSLAAAFGVSSSSTGEALRMYNGLNAYTGTVLGGDHPSDDENAPKLFATIVFFDRDYNLVEAAWDQVTTTGAQTSGTTKQPPHDLLSKTAKAPVAGYALVFLSNEHPKFVDAYFDDVTFSVTPSMVVGVDDYYPFGLSISGLSFQRENSAAQDFKYNGKELQDELGLGWLDYGARMYMAEIGRWLSIDPLSERMRKWSPYNYAFTNPIAFVDLDGEIPWPKVFGDNLTAKVRNRGFIDYPVEHPIRKYTKGNPEMVTHPAIDLSQAEGTQVRSLASGKVAKVGYSEDAGYYIVIDHGNGYKTKYAHLMKGSTCVKEDDEIKDGQMISMVGKTGTATGPHLHLAMYKNGKAIDPTSILDLEELLHPPHKGPWQGGYEPEGPEKATTGLKEDGRESAIFWGRNTHRKQDNSGMTWTQSSQLITSWLQANPSIKIN